ncbi:MAG TPA: choice-of-anchor D domain-containing protein [Candidatus Dormibacteraeota bacterium]|nr:choice-of-anchor D domain-containing protein [Candidatus Dormibacteraeota bacterium]
MDSSLSSKIALRFLVFALFIAATGFPSRAQEGFTKPVYVSNRQGGQILVVDGDTGAIAVLYNQGCVDSCLIWPEGLTVGPDNKIYMADPSQKTIRRIDRSGSTATLETLIGTCVTSPCPTGPQAPSFSGSPAGDLYFVDPVYGNSNQVYVIAGAGKVPFGGTFTKPAVVLQNCGAGSRFCEHTLSSGTAFDKLDNFLFDDVSAKVVWSSPPPYNSATAVVALATLTTVPRALALNKSTGQTFVSDTTGQILSIGSTGATTLYYAFGTDVPQFMQFDASGRLFVTTAQSATAPYHGKVWRLDPPVSPSSPPTAVLLVDLSTVSYLLGIRTDQADGLALPPTTYPPIALPLNPAGGTNRYTFGNGAFDYKIVYGPPSPANPNVNLVLQALPQTQQQLDSFTFGTPFAGATLAPYFGTGGYGIRFVATCQDAITLLTIPCPQFPVPYDVVTNYNGVLPSNVAFLTDEGNGPYLSNILTSATALRTGDPTIAGKKHPILSGFQVVGGITGTPPTIAIVAPANNATYALNQPVLANYTCTGPFVTQCLGNVLNGMPIDTASLGTKTFTVTALTSQGPTASTKVTYTVVATGPLASVSPSGVDFGKVEEGRFASAVVTLTNIGQAPMKVKGAKIIKVANGDSDDFFAFSLCPKTLAVGKSCSIWVFFYADRDTFKPQSATLAISDNAPDSPQLVPLSAIVIEEE